LAGSYPRQKNELTEICYDCVNVLSGNSNYKKLGIPAIVDDGPSPLFITKETVMVSDLKDQCGTLAAVCNLYGAHGAVIDLATGMTKMTFERSLDWTFMNGSSTQFGFQLAFCTAGDGSPR
jgi:hypothetical protein